MINTESTLERISSLVTRLRICKDSQKKAQSITPDITDNSADIKELVSNISYLASVTESYTIKEIKELINE